MPTSSQRRGVPRAKKAGSSLRPVHEGLPLLVALDQPGAAALGVTLAQLRRAALRLAPVAERVWDAAPLFRTVLLLDALDPERAASLRSVNGRHGNSDDRRAAERERDRERDRERRRRGKRAKPVEGASA